MFVGEVYVVMEWENRTPKPAQRDALQSRVMKNRVKSGTR